MTLKLLKIIFVSFLLLSFGAVHNINAQEQKVIQLQQRKTIQDRNSSTSQLAIKYYRSGQFDKAAELFSQLYKEKPSQYIYSYYLNCLIKLKEYKKAEKLIKQQNKKFENYRSKIDQAYIYQLMGSKKKTQNILNKLTNKVPENKSQVVQLASALQSRGYYDHALKVYKKANLKTDYSYDLEMANAYQLLGNYDKMFEAYLSHLEKKPEDRQRIKNRMQSLLRFDVNKNLNLILKQKLLLKTREFPENRVFSDLLLWHSMQSKDFEMAFMQASALDRRFGNAEGILLEVAEISLANKNYDVAVKTYKFMMDNHKNGPFYNESYSGYYNALVNKELDKNNSSKKNWNSLRKTGEKALDEIGINSESANISRLLGYIVAFRLFEYDKAKEILENALDVPNISIDEKSRIKLELADILVLQYFIWDASLLYSQIEADMKHEVIGHEAKFRNAKLFYYVGEFKWSLTRLDILKSATSKLIANDAMELSMFINNLLEEDTLGFTLRKFAAADLYSYRQQYDSAIIFLDRIVSHPTGVLSLEYAIYEKAGIFEKRGNYITADSLYQEMWNTYPESVKADNAIFKQAELNRLRLDKKDKAMELFLKVMKEHPDSVYASEARLRYREMREEDAIGNFGE